MRDWDFLNVWLYEIPKSGRGALRYKVFSESVEDTRLDFVASFKELSELEDKKIRGLVDSYQGPRGILVEAINKALGEKMRDRFSNGKIYTFNDNKYLLVLDDGITRETLGSNGFKLVREFEDLSLEESNFLADFSRTYCGDRDELLKQINSTLGNKSLNN